MTTKINISIFLFLFCFSFYFICGDQDVPISYNCAHADVHHKGHELCQLKAGLPKSNPTKIYSRFHDRDEQSG